MSCSPMNFNCICEFLQNVQTAILFVPISLSFPRCEKIENLHSNTEMSKNFPKSWNKDDAALVFAVARAAQSPNVKINRM